MAQSNFFSWSHDSVPSRHCKLLLGVLMLWSIQGPLNVAQANNQPIVRLASPRAYLLLESKSRLVRTNDVRGGATPRSTPPSKQQQVAFAQQESAAPLAWFKPGCTLREKWLGFWLLLWNSLALTDCIMFTFRAKQNLDGYLVGEWGPHTLAMTRMLANCQWALILATGLIAWRGNESLIKDMFKILILVTSGAFRAIYLGVQEGTIKAPWKTAYASALSLPPLLLLGYFAFVF